MHLCNIAVDNQRAAKMKTIKIIENVRFGVPLLFGLLWPEDDLSLLLPLEANVCFCSLWSCMEYSAWTKTNIQHW